MKAPKTYSVSENFQILLNFPELNTISFLT